MTDAQGTWLAVMAIALVVMALMQVGIAVAAFLAARQALRLANDVRQEIRPLIRKMDLVADEAVRTAALVKTQVERIDEIVSVTSERVRQVSGFVQGAFGGPLRQGALAFSIVRAIVSAVRGRSARKHRARDDEDALFVG